MKLIECPRDAMQGIHEFIPTDKKVAYINQLLKVGFDTIDFGSFVSPKAIPQLKDTAEVLSKLELEATNSHLLAIVANLRGAQDACQFEEINYLGFPLSISEQFQLRNTNKTIEQALQVVADIQDLCHLNDKTLVTYISMGFGNPYGEVYNEEVVAEFVSKLNSLEVEIVSLADTIGVAQPELIKSIFESNISEFESVEIGAHFHSTPNTAKEKIQAAYDAGCRRFDAAIKGYGGCPMAADDLTGNIATETLLEVLGHDLVDKDQFEKAMLMSLDVFPA